MLIQILLFLKLKTFKMKNIKIFKKNNPDVLGCKIGLMEDEIDKNDEIIEYIGLSSKCYSYITKKEKIKKKDIKN